MNATKYMQTDSRWSQLGYPKKPCTIGNSGCGEVAICNAIIEMEQYKNYTPKTIQPYCKQYAASNCDGTYWSGIPKMMKNYGMTEVKEHQTMDSLWKELKKGGRVAIYLMGKRKGGSKGIHWTSSGHFICSVDYRYKDNDHQVYIKDSYSNSKDRNGWLGYKTHLKGDVSAVWSGKLNNAKPTTPTITPTTTTTPTATAKPITTPKASVYKVIDVSEWQGTIDWKKVKADGVVGAIIRYADGTYLDPNFNTNMKNAKANGLHIGAYIFSRAKTKADAEKEATRLFNASRDYAPDMPLYIDLEAKGLNKYADTVAQAYLAKMKALGGYGGVYANYNWWTNYLKKTAKGSFAMWLAQYNKTMDYKPKSDVGMWQYSSSGSVKGIKGRVDMNHCYVAYWDKINPPTPTPTPPEKQGYQGTFPTLRLTKTNAEVIADAIAWAKKIEANNDFHYGKKPASQHNGCYYCGTQPKSKKNAGIKMWETTYCCNPFVGAAWGHGGCVPKALEMCQKGTSWDFHEGRGYDKSNLFAKLGKVAQSKLKAGDVLCSDNHVALYIGNGKVIHASGGDDNVKYSKKWNNSIRISSWSGWKRAYRFNSSVDKDMYIYHGEYSKRVRDMQFYLIWYGYNIKATGFYNNDTLKAVKDFQEKEIGKGQGDGIVGQKTIDAMKKVKK